MVSQELIDKAVQFLLNRGYNETQLANETALAMANDVRYKELVAEATKGAENSDDFFEFDGMNCDECAGWDGVSRRCECGNRRVYWAATGNFNYMTLYAAAD